MIIKEEEKDAIKSLVIRGYFVDKAGLSIFMTNVKHNVKLEEDEKPYRYQINYCGSKIYKDEVGKMYKSINHAMDEFVELAKDV